MSKKTKRKDVVLAVADCETDPFDGVSDIQPFIWGYYDGDNYEEFDTTEKFMEFIYTLPETILYAHNGGKFDWHFILDYIDDFEKVMIINGRLARFKIGDVEFRDSMNILPVSLKKMQKDTFDYNKMKREVRHMFMDEIKRYLYHDCIYLHKYILLFIEQYGLHLTQAGCAMKTWQEMSGVTAPNDVGGSVYHQFKHFYYGGRCESFYSGTFNHCVSVYDINSAYPYAMLSPHPISLTFKIWNHADDAPRPAIAGHYFIILDCISDGALPFRAIDGSLIFPDEGIRRTYHATGWEYLAGIETGALREVSIYAIYMADETIDFKDYIYHFYNLRKRAKEAGDGANDLFAKLLMNSLYGKFGSNPEHFNTFMIVDGGVISDDGTCCDLSRGETLDINGRGRWQFAGQLGSRFLAQKPIEEPAMRWYNVMTAASITGYVRAMIQRARCASEGVLYCDTDSLICKSTTVETGNELGQWKHEGDFKRGAIGGKKMYALEYTEEYWQKLYQKAPPGEVPSRTKVATKGARLDFDQVEAIANGEEIIYNPQSPTFSVHHAPRYTQRKIRKTDKKKPV